MNERGDDARRRRDPGPGYLWRPGSSPQDRPLQLVVAVIIVSILLGTVVLAILVS